MKPLPATAHTSHPWRIHPIAHDFELYDVWLLPTPGGPHDFDRLVQIVAGAEDDDLPSPVARALFTVRRRLGDLFGWDVEAAGLDHRVASLRDRLPPDLREASADPDPGEPFRSVYRTENEWAIEIANRTVHCLMHVSWSQHNDGWQGQLAVLVRPNGHLGRLYLAAIAPFRHWLVYPPLMRYFERAWRASAPSAMH